MVSINQNAFTATFNAPTVAETATSTASGAVSGTPSATANVATSGTKNTITTEATAPKTTNASNSSEEDVAKLKARVDEISSEALKYLEPALKRSYKVFMACRKYSNQEKKTLDVLHAYVAKKDWLDNPVNNRKPIEELYKVGGNYANYSMESLIKELAAQTMLLESAMAELKAEVLNAMNKGDGSGNSITSSPTPSFTLPERVQTIDVPTVTTGWVSPYPTAS